MGLAPFKRSEASRRRLSYKRSILDTGYDDITNSQGFSRFFTDLQCETAHIEQRCAVKEFVAYLGTWSSTARWRAAASDSKDPLLDLQRRLELAYTVPHAS